ncbi:MAG: hypothetical protein AAF434_07630 [Pseudomonadota bacterium]
MAENLKLGTHSDVLSTDSAEAIAPHLITFAKQARRHIQIFSPELTHVLYSNAEFIQSLSDSIRNNSRMRVQILLGDPGPSVRRGHRLLALMEKLGSYIEVRRTHNDFQTLTCDYMLADKRGYIFRNNAERFFTEICYNDRLTTDSYCKQFSHIWEMSTREREFLRLHI